METIKFRKCNQLNEKDLAEINKIMDILNEKNQNYEKEKNKKFY